MSDTYWYTYLLTGTFILQSNRARFNQNEVDPTCQLCYAESETLTHFLLKCRKLETVRKPILDKFNIVLKDIITVFSGCSQIYNGAASGRLWCHITRRPRIKT